MLHVTDSLPIYDQVRLPYCRSRRIFNVQMENASWGRDFLQEINDTFDEKGVKGGFKKSAEEYGNILNELRQRTGFSPKLGTVELMRYADLQEFTLSRWSEMNEVAAAKRHRMKEGMRATNTSVLLLNITLYTTYTYGHSMSNCRQRR